ncbi:hypothetical protein R3P38DRAFT_804740 [Favolaschia claudopus]|uniref:Uncharacterized protein n=1 Tax=Favolaschia claudopus TaxID=2862362 RepID=A0AAV9Z227_9AGAR
MTNVADVFGRATSSSRFAMPMAPRWGEMEGQCAQAGWVKVFLLQSPISSMIPTKYSASRSYSLTYHASTTSTSSYPTKPAASSYKFPFAHHNPSPSPNSTIRLGAVTQHLYRPRPLPLAGLAVLINAHRRRSVGRARLHWGWVSRRLLASAEEARVVQAWRAVCGCVCGRMESSSLCVRAWVQAGDNEPRTTRTRWEAGSLLRAMTPLGRVWDNWRCPWMEGWGVGGPSPASTAAQD